MAKTESKRKKKNVKLIALGVLVAVALILVVLGYTLPGNGESAAKAGTQSEYLNTSYAEYLKVNGYESAGQIRDDIEVVLVDDGSEKPLKTSYKWCKVLRKKNAGDMKKNCRKP